MLHLVSSRNKAQISQRPGDVEDEYALLARILDGDALAFEAFYKVYYSRLYRFMLRITRQPELVEELIQETLLVVWEKPEHFNFESKISTWVFGIAYNKALKSMSKISSHQGDVDIDELDDMIGDPAANPAQTWENLDWLNQALATLPPDQRAVIDLTFYHDLSYQDIARILDCPENTVKTRMFHARKKLQAFADIQ